MTESQIRQNFVDTAISYLNTREGTAAHQALVDLYNSHTPRARGYALKVSDPWCAAFVSAVAIRCSLTDIVPTEVGCGQMITLYQKLGRWQENDAYAPEPGDIIFYDWQDTGAGDNTGSADHVGIVVNTADEAIRVIEGNYRDAVSYRDISLDARYIRGFGLPDFALLATEPDSPAEKTLEQLVDEVIAGKWGEGIDRETRLTARGYDYPTVQNAVNRRLGKAADKSVRTLAQEVIAGKWGNGNTRKNRLAAAGYDASAVQAEVNRILSGNAKTVSQIAKEVIAGSWGNGETRKKRLTEAGYDYAAVQKAVNALLSGK